MGARCSDQTIISSFFLWAFLSLCEDSYFWREREDSASFFLSFSLALFLLWNHITFQVASFLLLPALLDGDWQRRLQPRPRLMIMSFSLYRLFFLSLKNSGLYKRHPERVIFSFLPAFFSHWETGDFSPQASKKTTSVYPFSPFSCAGHPSRRERASPNKKSLFVSSSSSCFPLYPSKSAP